MFVIYTNKIFYQSVGESLLLPDDGGPFTGEFSPPLISFILSSDLIGGFIGSKCAYCLAEFFGLILSCFLQRRIS
jgi:hypothetical protein